MLELKGSKIHGNEDPRLFRPKMKNWAMVVICMAGAMGGFSTTAYFPGMPDVGAELHAPPISISLSTALYVLSLGIAPIIWGFLSDHYKIRRPLILASMVIYVTSSIACALAYNIWILVSFRITQAAGASSSLAIGGGIISDIYTVEERGRASAVFFFGRYIGPIIGPVIGGFLVSSDLKWRAVMWFCSATGLVIFIIAMLYMPETYRDHKTFDSSKSLTIKEISYDLSPSETSMETIEMNEQQQPDKDKKKPFNFLRPLLLLRFPSVLLSSLVGAIAFGSLFVIETVVPILYEKTYGFDGLQIGLCYLGAGAGNILGAITNGYLSDKFLLQSRKKRGGIYKAEDRITLNLWPCCLILMPMGILLFGWSVEYNMPFWLGILGLGIQTFATSQLYSGSTAYLIDSLPDQSASVSAAGNFVFMAFASSLSLSSIPILNHIGPHYLSVIIASLGWVAAGMLLINKIYGQQMRRHFNLE